VMPSFVLGFDPCSQCCHLCSRCFSVLLLIVSSSIAGVCHAGGFRDLRGDGDGKRLVMRL
jgi:hypothetical protein